MIKKSKKQPETFTGNFSCIPHSVMDSKAFIGLTDHGKALLFALMRQVNGRNNGRLHLTNKWLSTHGWRSNSLNKKAIDELIERSLIVTTRLGGLNAGSNWYALTWLPISNFVGLDLSVDTYKQGCWLDCKLPPTQRRKPPSQKQKKSPDYQDSTIPKTGPEKHTSIPGIGTKIAFLPTLVIPTTGNNVSMPYTHLKTIRGNKRIVGKSHKVLVQK